MAAKSDKSAKLNIRGQVSIAAFLILFPGYMVYHFLLSAGQIPPFLGGYFGPMSVVLLPILLALSFVQLSDRGLAVYEWLVLLFFAYCIVWVAAHLILGEGFQGSIGLAVQTASYLPLLIVLYLAGLSFPAESTLQTRWLLLALVSMVLMVVGQLDENFIIGAIRNAAEQGIQTSTYQGYSRSVLIIALLLLANSRGVATVFYIAATTVTLFLIGARSEFAGFLFVTLVMLPYWFRMNRWAAAGLIFAGCIGIYAFLNSAISLDLFRVSELLDLKSSTSFQNRREYTNAAIQTIIENPIIGNYGSDHLGYSHNALGAWVSFGFLGFAIYVCLVIVAAADSLVRIISSPRTAAPIWLSSVCLNMYSLIMIVAAKHISDPVIAIGWGVYAAAIGQSRAGDETESVDPSCDVAAKA